MDQIFEFLLIHRFFVGLSIGLVVGCTLGVLIICGCVVSGDSDQRIEEMERGKGKQFGPQILEIFLNEKIYQ